MFQILPTLDFDLGRFIGSENIALFNRYGINCFSVLEAVTIILVCFTTIITSRIYLLYSISDVHRSGILPGGRPLDQARTKHH